MDVIYVKKKFKFNLSLEQHNLTKIHKDNLKLVREIFNNMKKL